MKTLLMSFILLLSPSLLAESLELSPMSFEIDTENAGQKLEQVILRPESMLKRFHPVGAKITEKEVSQNSISFIATKTILFVSKSVYVNGNLETNTDQLACSKGRVGYSLKMNFDTSDRLVTENVEELKALLCFELISDRKLIGTVQSKILLGNNYSRTLGPIAISLIKQQVKPLVNALIEEVKK